MHKKKIKEIIVVEGKDDISAVKKAVDASLIEVNGFAVRKKETLEKIKFAQESQGVIVLCDPDFAGEKIRETISNYVSGIKHAYISRKEGTKKDNIGVENAGVEAIIKALEGAKCQLSSSSHKFTMNDLIEKGLVGSPNSSEKRDLVGTNLRIGYSNGKQFLNKLNYFGISKEKFELACELIR